MGGLTDMTSELLTLLDLIEITSTEDSVHDLTVQRHDIARSHGLTVVFGEPVSGAIQ